MFISVAVVVGGLVLLIFRKHVVEMVYGAAKSYRMDWDEADKGASERMAVFVGAVLFVGGVVMFIATV
jgi:uncharacterized membrane protein